MIAFIFAARFVGFQLGKKLQQANKDQKLNSKQLFVAGFTSGLTSCFITAPVERLKCILQSQLNSNETKKFKGPIDCMRSLYKQNGIKSLFRGYSITLIRDCPCLGIYYMTYELTNRKLNNFLKTKNVNTTISKPFSILLSGAVAGWSYWIPIGT